MQTIDSNGNITRALCGTCCKKEGITNPSYARKKGLYLKYKDGKVFCPRCGAEYKVIKTPEEYEAEKKEAEAKRNAEALENLHVAFAGKDMSTGIEFYSLSARVDNKTIWPKIKKYFSYYKAGWSNDCDTDFEMYGFEPSGWLTTQPEKVEVVLIAEGVMKEENTLKARREAEVKAKAERKAKADAKAKLKSEIDSAIMKNKSIEKPKIDNYTHTIEEYGDEVVERHEDPNYRFNIYGGGIEYIICKEHIWKVKNNGSDGADWNQNNIATGGAGAIGVRIPYTDELAEKIKEYCKI